MSGPPPPPSAGRPAAGRAGRTLDREIFHLAVPAFLALVAEPLFLLADSAVVGHLGTVELAGLGIASVVLRMVVGLCVFLAYATTASVAREIGAGHPRAALAQGLDGMWLAVLVGVVLTALGIALTDTAVGLFDINDAVAAQATTYLAISWYGLVPMLLMLAATGVLRGLQDTRTPLVVAVAANVLNIVLNVVLVYGLDLGIGGSALGTVLAQVAGAVTLVGVVLRRAVRETTPKRPDFHGVRRAAWAGVPLLIRTANLHLCLLSMTAATAALGVVATAAQQLAFTVWTFLVFALDALAIAAQTMTGAALGAGDTARVRMLTGRFIRLSLVAGIVTGLMLAAAAPVLGWLFVDDRAVVEVLTLGLLVAALGQPLAAVVFVLDGVLIGAGDGRYLAIGSTAVTVVFLPALAVLTAWVAPPGGLSTGAAFAVLWAGFSFVFVGARAVVLLHRARGETWLVVGSAAGATARG